jgi:hypothetical protein
VSGKLAAEVFGVFDQTISSSKRFRASRGLKMQITNGQFIGYLATLLNDVGADDKKIRVEINGIGGRKMPISAILLRAV